MPKNLSSRAMSDLETHYSRLRDQEERDEVHWKTALQRFVSSFRPGSNEGPTGEALARAFERVEQAFHQDVDPDTGKHRARSMTLRSLDQGAEDYAKRAGMPVGPLAFTLDGVEQRCDARGFPLNVWHPALGSFVPAKWSDNGDLLEPDLSPWLDNQLKEAEDG